MTKGLICPECGTSLMIVEVHDSNSRRVLKYKCPICGYSISVSKAKDKMRVICFKCQISLLERLDRYAKGRGLGRSEIIREAIEEYLNKRSPTRTAIRVKRVVLH